MNEQTVQGKQKYLRQEIIEGGFQPQPFMMYMGSVKNEGQGINLDNWTLAELKQTVQEYKQCLKEQEKWETEKLNKVRQSTELMTSRIMESILKKEKVYYGRAELWDYQIYTEHQCKKIQKFFDFNRQPQIDYKSWDIKKKGGFLFGLGATNELQITFITNFTDKVVTRSSQDLDWLRDILIHHFPGSYVPPLQPIRHIEPQDKSGIMKRVKQIILFLNSLTNYVHLVQNKYFFHFITDQTQKQFKSFKSQTNFNKQTADIGSIQNLEGKFRVQISQRMNTFIKETSNFAHDSNGIYENLENNLRKVMGDMETFTKHTHYIANDYAKLHEKYTKMIDKCKIREDKMGNLLIYMNNLFTTVGNVMKKSMLIMKELSQDFIKYTHNQWTEFTIHEKKYNYELNNYLTMKENLIKKKQKYLNEPSKWELSEKEQFRMSRINTGKMNKSDAFESMFPRDNQIEEETRIWQAYINNMYEKSFNMLLKEQEEMYVKNYGKYCVKLEKISEQQLQIYQKFKEIFCGNKK